ncbi:DUF2478 domain-containing protein [Methylocella sp.]|uniref:DUF2478 domain-containing protein n=1 Tax=Methylocella sp. TaxID=1978226 RepID=UPI00378518EF
MTRSEATADDAYFPEGPPGSPAKPLAAFVFDDSEEANRIVADFAAELAREGRRVAGVIQRAEATEFCRCREAELLNVETGESFTILQDLGRGSDACRIDPGAIARAGVEIARALEGAPELLFVNRFGKLEMEGEGLTAEIGAAVLSGAPTLVCVARRFLPPWREFAGGLADEIPCCGVSLRRWWRTVEAGAAAANDAA